MVRYQVPIVVREEGIHIVGLRFGLAIILPHVLREEVGIHPSQKSKHLVGSKPRILVNPLNYPVASPSQFQAINLNVGW
jgi:hypothetical protein